MPLSLMYDDEPKVSGIQIWLGLSGYESLPFRGTLTDRSQLIIPGREDRAFDMFFHINGYWATLTRDRQEGIFLKMREIHQTMEEVFDTTELLNCLIELVKELIDMHPFESVKWWLMTQGGAVIPPTVSEVYQGAEQVPGSRAQTYLRAEYEELITLSTILRTMYPIFMMFVYKTSRTVGTKMKEYFAFMLLGKSYVISHSSMERIRVYIQGCLARRGPVDLQQIFSGQSSEDFPTYILASLLVKKICCGDVRGVGVSGQVGSAGSLSLVHVMWQSVDSMIVTRGGHSSSRVTPKKSLDASSGDADDSAPARLEMVKLTAQLSLADVAIMQHSGKDPYCLVRRIDPSVPDETIDVCVRCTRVSLQEGVIPESKVTLAKYVLSDLINPHALNLMYKPELINCIAAAQAVLWHKGYKVLAAILGAKLAGGDDQTVFINAATSRTRISQSVIQGLLDIYSFIIPTSAVSLEDRVKWMRGSDVLQSISHLTGSISRSEWVINLPDDWVREVTGNAMDRVVVPPSDMVSVICMLLVDIDKWSCQK